MQFTNVHAGICAFVGVGSDGREEILIEKLISTLQSQELKDGQCGLQSALLQIIQNSMDATKDKNCIRSSGGSTRGTGGTCPRARRAQGPTKGPRKNTP